MAVIYSSRGFETTYEVWLFGMIITIKPDPENPGPYGPGLPGCSYLAVDRNGKWGRGQSHAEALGNYMLMVSRKLVGASNSPEAIPQSIWEQL
jgi:hypothetical protein